MKNLSSKSTFEAEQKIVSAAQKILEKKIELLEGCRQLSALCYKISESEDIFLPIIGIVSETDDFPIGSERKSWNEEALRKMDKERDQYLLQVEDIIIDTCQKIIQKYS